MLTETSRSVGAQKQTGVGVELQTNQQARVVVAEVAVAEEWCEEQQSMCMHCTCRCHSLLMRLC